MKYAIIRQQMNLLILVSISFSSRIEVNIMVVTTAVSYTAGGGEGVTVNHLRLASGLDSGACLLSRLWEAEWFGHPSDRSGVPSTVYILVHLLRHLLRMAEVCCGDRHLHHDDNVVNLDGLQSAVVVHVAHLICYDGGDHIIDLFHVQRTDGSGVTDARFTNHRLGKLHLSCDVGHLH